MRRGQAAVLLVSLAAPACAAGLLGLACLGVRARTEHAQRLADAAAVRAALRLPPIEHPPGWRVEVRDAGRDARAVATQGVVRLRLPLVGEPVAVRIRAEAVARPVVTGEGRVGAVIVG